MEQGLKVILVPALCRGYFGDEMQTNKLLRTHEDGKTWLHSGEKGYLDENGFLFFRERTKRMYVRFDGTKILEQVILKSLIVTAVWCWQSAIKSIHTECERRC